MCGLAFARCGVHLRRGGWPLRLGGHRIGTRHVQSVTGDGGAIGPGLVPRQPQRVCSRRPGQLRRVRCQRRRCSCAQLPCKEGDRLSFQRGLASKLLRCKQPTS